MSEEPQGVAQRVIANIAQRGGERGIEAQHVRDVMTGGAQELHAELSAEARRVLAEFDERDRQHGMQSPYAWSRIHYLLERLGLDVEDEDE